MTGLEIHYFAAARAARGRPAEELDPAAEGWKTLGALTEALGARHTENTAGGLRLAEVFDRCTFLLDGRAAAPDSPLAGALRVDVLPPFAGG